MTGCVPVTRESLTLPRSESHEVDVETTEGRFGESTSAAAKVVVGGALIWEMVKTNEGGPTGEIWMVVSSETETGRRGGGREGGIKNVGSSREGWDER